MNLLPINCPSCNTLIVPTIGIFKTSSCYNDCLRQCVQCQLAFSNSKSNPTLIYQDLRSNIPELLHENIDRALSNSFNVRNRKNKRNKFAFSTSEDALTWSFFNYFVVSDRLNDLLQILNIDSSESDFEIYLWGVNITSDEIKTDLYKRLIEVSDSIGENTNSRSEPDVIIKLKAKIIFIEVKYRSFNDVKMESTKFKKYLVPKVDNKIISNNGHYELFRNWAFATKLSDGCDFELINLGFSNLFKGKKLIALQEFENIIKTEKGKFVKLTWEEIMVKFNVGNFDSWFVDYLNRKLVSKI
ncbi:hypothetical protein HNQ02_000574 [Flavobacterium sp. 7E]|uniref:hypothetical protein n=1 Tax=Flavobacterium sp. 7E TaxID=2735898 RepID=UPI00157151CB|nr:hypothetical protein [Flavobacterium sp. 7E]NRS87667.1 hypothetical protein [Flavobacterium sp. 7E]